MTLHDFLFSLNQDEDILVSIYDYHKDAFVIEGWWKSGLRFHDEYPSLKHREVEYFLLCYIKKNTTGLEIVIN